MLSSISVKELARYVKTCAPQKGKFFWKSLLLEAAATSKGAQSRRDKWRYKTQTCQFSPRICELAEQMQNEEIYGPDGWLTPLIPVYRRKKQIDFYG